MLANASSWHWLCGGSYGRCRSVCLAEARTDHGRRKGLVRRPRESDLEVSVGFASAGVDEPHVHSRLTVARGSASIRVGGETSELQEGDALISEPGEAHAFLAGSDDHLHFVIRTPGLAGDEARAEKQRVPRSRLGHPR